MTKIHKKHKKHRIHTSNYGTSDIAVLCSVTPVTVAKWIDDGKLSAHLTVGGHRRVSESDLMTFMRRLKMPLPSHFHLKNLPPILIVDDDKDDLEFMIEMVKQSLPSAKIHVATDGFSVGHKMATFHPVLVVLDLMMPGIDGFKVCETIRQDPKLANVKILAVSGVATEKMKEKILQMGADDFLPKDAVASAWVEKLNTLLATGRILAHAAN